MINATLTLCDFTQQQTLTYQYTEAATAEILHLSCITAAENVLLRDRDERLLLTFN